MQNKADEVRVTAKNLDLALIEAATRLQVDQNQLDYRVLSQGSSGLFSFLSKKVEISAWKKVLNFDEMMAEDGPEGEVEELSPEEVDVLRQDLQGFCRDICSAISGKPVNVTAELEGGRLILDCDEEYLAGQMVKNSKLAEALEHILRKKPRHIKRELPFRIFVDVQGVRLKREADLVELARDLSEKVHENKRPIVLNYKSSYDRKIIHMALDKDERVYTKSIGTGPNRKLMILPIRKKDEPAYDEI
ncbi:MAG: Jag N-terminal domain-containing protein [Proteobacteria bacterium]|nr:Jag N-terminal domain-containing protein [Pseudomonadota bacterium]